MNRSLSHLPVIAAAALVLSSAPATAAQDTVGAWRRWPWRNGVAETLTQVEGHSYASPSARKAIDIGMRYEAVHAIGPGKVVTVASDRGAGNYVQVLADDGSVITYEHLSRFETSVGTRLWQGDRIAVSGATGNVTGPHLHLQRSRTTSFQSEAMTLAPIDGVYSPRTGMQAKSSNAGIGTTAPGDRDDAMRAAYARYGGWSVVGAPQTLTSRRTPCWSSGRTPTRWMYACAGGFVQTYEKGSADTLLLSRANVAFKVSGVFHVALVLLHPNGKEYLEVLGFPQSEVIERTPYETQVFERGRMTREAGSCQVTIVVDGQPARTVTTC